MRQIIKNSINLLIFALVATLFSGCEEDPKFSKYVYPQAEVSQMYPSSGYVTEQVTIIGNNFGDRTEPVKVTFGGIPAKNVLSCKNNAIVVEVPEGALTGEVTLQLWTNPAISIGTFTVFPTPTLISIASDNADFGPTVAVPGDIVTIIGTGFGTDQDAVSVSFNGTPAKITSLEDEMIVVETPEDYKSGAVLVTINGYTLTGTGLMNPNSVGDVTMFYLKNYKRPFTQVPYESGQIGDGKGLAIPTDWIVNDAAKVFVNKNADAAAGKVGGMFPGANALGMQVGWGGTGSGTSITNGKMYQTTTLPSGVYTLEVTYVECNVSTDATYIVVAAGVGLPDTDQVESSSIVFTKFTQNIGASNPAVTETLEFTLDNNTEVSIGMSATFGNNKYIKISDIKLNLIEKR
ncbi:DUF5013 domain-containing protein [Dysgonomonas sp. 511]|uniref:DUF5013 domain-containing protein n=1 Tax=Dysgonomonas sp. 511 TaxID=2302930 RepID=UPI0013D64E6F|nr:DUF5013 domain-containing protein [Dysgonomonas sp. 511]